MQKTKIFLLFSILLLASCDKSINELVGKQQSGVIASVNGENIFFTEAEKMLDLKKAAQNTNHLETKEQLQDEYIAVTNELIVQKLIHSELIKKNIFINYSKVNNFEQSILDDYKDVDFMEIFKEDGIDYEFWKKQMLAGYEKIIFMNTVLKPELSISIEDIEKEYLNRVQNFKNDTIYELLVYQSTNKEQLKQALADPKKKSELVAVPMKAKTQDLPEEWRSEISKLTLNKTSTIHENDGEYIFIELVNKTNTKVPDILELYTLIEKDVTKEDLEKSFEKWLEDTINSSEIKISKTLITKE